ncbi:MAG: hypothetical protein RBU37_28300, partial [Myxococcota bacterium]|nr:hypothetical protein [Myxococcota bacterium]
MGNRYDPGIWEQLGALRSDVARRLQEQSGTAALLRVAQELDRLMVAMSEGHVTPAELTQRLNRCAEELSAMTTESKPVEPSLALIRETLPTDRHEQLWVRKQAHS